MLICVHIIVSIQFISFFIYYYIYFYYYFCVNHFYSWCNILLTDLQPSPVVSIPLLLPSNSSIFPLHLTLSFFLLCARELGAIITIISWACCKESWATKTTPNQVQDAVESPHPLPPQRGKRCRAAK